MRCVYKFRVHNDEVLLPKGSQILSVIIQQNNVVLYALVETAQKQVEKYSVLVMGTGYTLPSNIHEYTFLSTIIEDDTLVWHVFYKKQSD